MELNTQVVVSVVYCANVSYTLLRGIDDENFVVLDGQFQDSGWRVQFERLLNSWSVAHADSNGLSEVALSLGYFDTPEAAAIALERIAPSR